MTTKSLTVASDIRALIKARNPILWIVSKEEARVEPYIFEAAAAVGCITRTWDCGAGVAEMDGRRSSLGSTDLGDSLSAISQAADASNATPCVWVLRDAAPWLSGPLGITPVRLLRNLARKLPGKPITQTLVIISPSGEVPAELADHTTVIEWPMPDRAEIESILDTALLNVAEEDRAAAVNGSRDRAIDAALGLSGEEAMACYSKSLIQLKKIDPIAVAQEKKRVIARERILEWYDPIPGGLNAIGGLENLKDWLTKRRLAYSAAARAYGLPMPKGGLLVGIPGCGKSLTAKCFATALGVPLLKLDLGALKSKFVGESEANLRKAFRVVEAIGPCVLWIDEIEKALAGATQGAADGGVSSDALGAVLNWMQERTSPAFVIATANDISALPPELLRKGRFDEIWYVGMPNHTERMAVIAAAMRANARDVTLIDPAKIADETEGYTGAEIAALVPEAMFEAFADGQRPINTDDLVKAAKGTVPMSKTASDKIAKLENWAKEGRARFASAEEAVSATKQPARALKL